MVTGAGHPGYDSGNHSWEEGLNGGVKIHTDEDTECSLVPRLPS